MMSVSQTAAYQHRVGDHMTSALVLVPQGTAAVKAVRRMTEAGAAGITVVDDSGMAAGIDTERDVSRRLASP